LTAQFLAVFHTHQQMHINYTNHKLSVNITLLHVSGISPYSAVNTFHHGYKTQSVNDV